MKYKKVNDLKVYNDSIDLAVNIYSITKNERLAKDFGYKDQLRRAVVSISNNISEGFEYDSNEQFIRFLYYAKGSASEVRNILEIGNRINYINNKEYTELTSLTTEILKQLGGFIKFLKN